MEEQGESSERPGDDFVGDDRSEIVAIRHVVQKEEDIACPECGCSDYRIVSRAFGRQYRGIIMRETRMCQCTNIRACGVRWIVHIP